MYLTMKNRKRPRAAVLCVVACAVPDQGQREEAEPKSPSFQAALLKDAVMQPDCAAVPDVM
jgi:hypothetical protein